MATQTPEQTPRKQGNRIAPKTVLLVVAAVILTIFAVQNLEPATIWPLGKQPVIVVIFISFVLGALIGWLSRSIITPHGIARKD